MGGVERPETVTPDKGPGRRENLDGQVYPQIARPLALKLPANESARLARGCLRKQL